MAQIITRETAAGEKRYDVRTRIGGRVVTKTFRTKREATNFAHNTEADRSRGVAIDPRAGRVTVDEYAREWLAHRHDLAASTRALYGYLLDAHIVPTFGPSALSAVTPSAVAAWHAALFKRQPTTAAKAYRLLAAVIGSAVNDDVLGRSPCRVKGAASEQAPERPVASVAEVQVLADTIPDDQRLAVLLAAWCQLRRGELLGLRRRDVGLMHATLTVAETRVRPMGARKLVTKGPKSAAGRRTVAVPPNVVADLEHHLARHVAPEPGALVFPKGFRPLRTAWDNARRTLGVSYRLHDLRHAGLTWTAATGATVAELMHRAGPTSPAAALRYQHATADRDQALAAALAELVPVAEVVELKPAAR